MSRIYLQYPKNPKVEANWRAKMGNLTDFLTSIVAKRQKIEAGNLLDIFFRKRSFTMPKKKRMGDVLGKRKNTVMYVTQKNRKIFFGSVRYAKFVWIEKKRVTITVAFHFMKRRLKMGDPE